ncbi:ribbon-helix-helix domain-containing protein [Candidatus Nitrospira inopinata]|jgi:metal-responsive CopG/Arc/MetJ family transcriptional regulator|uniref:Ribbon-helix-helix protein CopG domain-containing protein n=1 Tax=Candidatus Nitrospira inopinata TaxID=1715989 RepID=A0A0S4L229_9BACT|nr:ribbon-helix-helix domain-containing protein [Candidatus Nitrospira inopinata]CUQ68066.1 protein of unknown function [Candidatus Nitrospira inopinata]
MKRTTIFANESLMESLREIAIKERTTVSATIRAAIEEYVGRRQPARTLPSAPTQRYVSCDPSGAVRSE